MNEDERHELITQIRIAIAELRKEVKLKFEANQIALGLQAALYEQHFKELNDTHAYEKSLQATYITKREHEILLAMVNEARSWIDKEKGSKSVSLFISTIAVIISAIAMFLHAG